jgi:hypothetical protein
LTKSEKRTVSNLSESEIIRKFHEYIAGKKRPEGLKVTCRVTGGMPSERAEEEFSLLGDGNVTVMTKNMLDAAIPYEASEKLQEAETRELLIQIEEGLKSLVTRQQARFLPDSPIGTITIEVLGEKATFYYLADEEDRLAQDKSISPKMSEAIQRINTISQRLMRKMRSKDE